MWKNSDNSIKFISIEDLKISNLKIVKNLNSIKYKPVFNYNHQDNMENFKSKG